MRDLNAVLVAVKRDGLEFKKGGGYKSRPKHEQ